MYADLTLRETAVLYLKSYKLGTIKNTSYNQLLILIGHIPEKLLNTPISHIKKLDLQAFINAFAQNSSKSYVLKMGGLIKSIFCEAVENGFISKNPAHNIKIPYVKEKVRECFTIDEVRKIVDYALHYSNQRIAVAIIVLLFTGLRRGEPLGLKWTDIDTNNNVLKIRRSVYTENNRPCVTENSAKTESSIRDIPLLPEVAYKISQLPKYSEFIFSTRNSTLMNPRNFSRDYKTFFKHLKEVEPDVRCLSPHCCRHTFATLTLASSNNLRSVQAILGHTSIKTTSIYTHPDMDMMNNAIEKYVDHLGY